MKKLTLFLTISLVTIGINAQTTAVYDIVFTSNWEAHGTLPNNAHFTELVGATHNDNITFLAINDIATPGIEQVAETGAFSTFENEVITAINNNAADQFIEGDNLFFNGSGRTITISDLTVNESYPLISLVSMLAPSPDWIVAVNSISLLDNQGEWLPEITMDIFAYDAGTEEGTGYSLNNAATNPQEPISMLSPSNSPLMSEKIGTLVITEKVLSTPSFDKEKDGFTMTPNPSNNGIIAISMPQNIDAQNIEVYNTLGKLVKSYTSTTKITELHLTDLQKGMYLVKTQNPSGTFQTQKLLLQ